MPVHLLEGSINLSKRLGLQGLGTMTYHGKVLPDT
jgi:hypothetical protein